MKNNIVIVMLAASFLGGCSLIGKTESAPEPNQEVAKYQCADCESETSRLKQEITSLVDQLASANKDLDEANKLIAEGADADQKSSLWKRVLLNVISIAIGIAIGYFVFRDKKKV